MSGAACAKVIICEIVLRKIVINFEGLRADGSLDDKSWCEYEVIRRDTCNLISALMPEEFMVINHLGDGLKLIKVLAKMELLQDETFFDIASVLDNAGKDIMQLPFFGANKE